MPTIEIREGDCLDLLRALPPDSVDAIVTDPPYGLGFPPPIADVLRAWLAGDEYRPRGRGFMGHAWDAFVPGPEVWRECLRVLKPGGHLLAFFGSRTVDVGGLAIRLAGFEIRDSLCWLYGTGFPKSLDVSKAIDRAAGAEREVIGTKFGRPGYSLAPSQGASIYGEGIGGTGDPVKEAEITAPATPEAEQWEGWGTALKPAHEPIVMARKPLAARTVAAQVLATGTGALNVDACRIGWIDEEDKTAGRPRSFPKAHPGFEGRAFAIQDRSHRDPQTEQSQAGRWPANVVLDEEAAEMLDAQSGWASRFFYCAKASKAERDAGLSGPEIPRFSGGHGGASIPLKGSPMPTGKNTHPTVKPIALMGWLVRMVTPPGGLVVDPFAGSGSTLLAARAEGFDALGFEREPSYAAIARGRLGLPDPCAAVEDVTERPRP